MLVAPTPGGQVFSLSPADSTPWWWGFVESAGQIAIFFIATWWQAPYSHLQESFFSPVDTVSAFHHETCWCFHFDFRCLEKLLGVWFASHSQTSEEDVCVMPAPELGSMYPTHGSVTRGAGESSSALCCDGSRPGGTTLLLWHSSEEILGSFVYMCCGARCAPGTGWHSTYDTVLAFQRLWCAEVCQRWSILIMPGDLWRLLTRSLVSLILLHQNGDSSHPTRLGWEGGWKDLSYPWNQL